jgi:hypothetical protein
VTAGAGVVPGAGGRAGHGGAAVWPASWELRAMLPGWRMAGAAAAVRECASVVRVAVFGGEWGVLPAGLIASGPALSRRSAACCARAGKGMLSRGCSTGFWKWCRYARWPACCLAV